MKRPDEYELIELQRNAAFIFSRLDEIADYMAKREEKFSPNQIENIEAACNKARQISDGVDKLAEFVRRSL